MADAAHRTPGLTAHPCPLCGAAGCRTALSLPEARLASSDASRALEIAVCGSCGFVFQQGALDPGYAAFMRHAYESWDDQPLFAFPRKSEDNLAAAAMIARHSRPDASVLEIGSNRGDVLALVKELLPQASVLGVDPAAHSGLAVPTLRAFFAPELFASSFDTVILKQVLEHYADPRPMLAGARQVLKDGGTLYLDVPNLARILEGRTDAFLLEHAAYYTLSTLQGVLAGYEILEAQEAGSLRVAARKLPGPDGFALPAGGEIAAAEAVSGLARLVRGRERGQRILAAHAQARGRVVFFGAYNCFRALYRELSRLLDDCPRAVLDDALEAEREPVFGLERIAVPQAGDLVLLCSNNACVLGRMEARLRALGAGSGFAVLRPWSTILRADGTTSDLGA
ncbi:MAG: class I SAM-dependent methyltransferase [Proteobacteria bacterium]|nr:class I SAM-dependent methyltransferase [Pseudomonadota bacterium]MBU1594057.1 class I SAM-dependent methyltransferase [Pseudomonadota bacterium]